MIRLSQRWSSGAVLQHSCPQQLSGTAAPHQRLQLSLQSCGQIFHFDTQTDTQGRFNVALPPQPPSGPWTLCISDGVLASLRLEDLWFGELLLFAGQSNVGWPLARYPDQLTSAKAQLDSQNLPLLRCYHSDQADFQAAGQWRSLHSECCDRWPALLYHFAQYYRPAAPDIMLGLVDISWPGSALVAWMQDAEEQTATQAWQRGALFAARLAPWLQQPFCALIWYQGEQDAMSKASARYGEQLQHWLDSCRQYAGWDFPLLLVQIAGFGASGRPELANGFVQVRQAQQQVARMAERCDLVCAADLGDARDIHPSKKAELAHRMALQLNTLLHANNDSRPHLLLEATALTVTTADKAILRLPAGVVWRGVEPLEGFFVECAQSGWQATLARLTSDQQSLEISLPAGARRVCYGMAALPRLTLFSAEGLPLLPGLWPIHQP